MQNNTNAHAHSPRTKVSIVVPAYNAASTIGELLESLARQDWNGGLEVLVVDNGSRDDSYQTALSYQDRLSDLRVLRATEIQGPAYARNVGAAAATGEFILFCDADDVAEPSWVREMAACLGDNPFVACRHDLTRLGSDYMRFARGAPQSNGLLSYTYPPYLPHAGGSGLGVRRWLHEKIGGFDETLFLMEDTDYCWRIQHMGIELKFAANAVLHYRVRGDLKQMCRQSYRWASANVLLYKRYRERGMPALSVRAGLRRVLGVLLRVHWVANRRTRPKWFWLASWQVGRIAGSIRYRTPAI